MLYKIFAVTYQKNCAHNFPLSFLDTGRAQLEREQLEALVEVHLSKELSGTTALVHFCEKGDQETGDGKVYERYVWTGSELFSYLKH